MNKTLTALVLALGLAASGAAAQTVVTDTDGNGTYSIEEMKAAYPDLTDATFTEIDVDGSGQIDAAELAFNRMLREVGSVMRLDVKPTFEARRSVDTDKATPSAQFKAAIAA